MSLWVLSSYGLISWILGVFLGYRWGMKEGNVQGYLRGYRDGGKGKTFKRNQATY